MHEAKTWMAATSAAMTKEFCADNLATGYCAASTHVPWVFSEQA
jgi:hypothetical protein